MIKLYKFTLNALLKALTNAATKEDKKSEASIKAAKAAELVAIRLRESAQAQLAQAGKFREEARKVSALI
jgi:hypothetical protein